jgi:signal transduction histidine kinase/ligand-binding sensor domain-containing protein
VIRVVLFLLLLFSITLTWAQKPYDPIVFDHITLPGAISSSQVSDIVQDKYGFIWISGDGLFRYDGASFRVFKQFTNTKRLDGREINVLFYDSINNKLLIGTHSHGIITYNYQTDQLEQLSSREETPIVSFISQTANGRIWINSFSDGLHYLQNDTIVKYTEKEFKNPSCLLAVEDRIFIDQHKTIYIIKDKNIIDSLHLDMPGVQLPELTRVSSMMFDSKKNLWIGTDRSGVLVYNTQQKKYIKYFSPKIAPFFNRINKIFEDDNGMIWILAKSNGIALYNPKQDELTLIKKDRSNNSLSGDNCTSIIQDKTGIIWVGASGPVNKYDINKVKFKHINQNSLQPVALTDNMVRGVYEDRNQKIWIGSDGGTIHIFDRFKNTMEIIPATLPGSNQNFVPAYFLDLDDNTLLMGTSLGLLQFNRKTKAITYFPPLKDLTKGRLVRQMIISGDYLYCIHSGILIRYHLKTGDTKTIVNFSDGKHQSINNATTIYQDSQKRIWLGVSRGISVYHEDSETFQFFPIAEKVSRTTGSYFMILSFTEFNGKLWIGTFNSGLWYFDLTSPINPKVSILTENEGLPNNTVYAAIPDTDGNLWLTTNNGISKFTPKTLRFYNFSVEEGLQQEEFNRLAFHRCANGEIVFGGINGLNIFNPKNIEVKEVIYQPHLIDLRAVSSNGNSYFFPLYNKQAINLHHSQNEFEVHYFIPNYQEPKRFEVYYKLINHDLDWLPTSSGGVRYRYLQPGKYELQIKTVSATGREAKTSMPITITPPFYKTNWFIGLIIIAVAFFVGTIVTSYARKTRLDKERLESLLQERTREIVKSREELANLNEKKDLIFSILSHDLRAPLTTLKGFLTVLIDGADSLSTEEIVKHATNIRNSVTSSLDLIDNTLFWSLSQTGNITYSPSSFSIGELLNKIVALYQLTADKKKVQLSIFVQEKPVMVYADENMIYVIMRNIVSNAIKFTPDGKSVNIHIGSNHQMAEIRVVDEGVGMSPSYLKKLLTEEQLQLKKGTSNEKGTGLGVILCKKFVRMNNGYMEIKSEENKGTEFMVKLPTSSTN